MIPVASLDTNCALASREFRTQRVPQIILSEIFFGFWALWRSLLGMTFRVIKNSSLGVRGLALRAHLRACISCLLDVSMVARALSIADLSSERSIFFPVLWLMSDLSVDSSSPVSEFMNSRTWVSSIPYSVDICWARFSRRFFVCSCIFGVFLWDSSELFWLSDIYEFLGQEYYFFERSCICISACFANSESGANFLICFKYMSDVWEFQISFSKSAML